MATKKKMETMPEILDGLPENSEEMLVQKSWPLLALWRSDLTLPELKILDSYLARINSHNDEAHTVVFEKGQLEEILQVKRINFTDLRSRMGHLMMPVTLQSENEFRQVALFEEAYCKRDEDGLWQVTLTCTNAAMRYFFHIEDLGYLRYKLRSVASLGSRYSYVLFLYIEANRFRGSWEVRLEDLRRVLRCEEEGTYDSYKRFNDRLLKRCYQELTEKTELRFSYEPVRTGRSVTGVRFTVASLPVLDAPESGQSSMFDVFDPEAEKRKASSEAPPDKPAPVELKSMSVFEMARELGIWEGDLAPTPETDCAEDYASVLGEYSREQRQELYEALCGVSSTKLPSMGSLQEKRSAYLRMKLAELSRRCAGGKIKSPYAYLVKMIKNDMK